MSENKTKAQELQDLQEAQLQGNAPKIKANKNEQYEIAEAEKDYVHVKLATRTNNPATQSYDESERVVAFRPSEFEDMEAGDAFAGYYSQEIIHDPRSKAEIKAAEKKATK